MVSQLGKRLAVSGTQVHAPMPLQSSPSQRRPCALKQRSSTWHHRSGLRALNWTLTRPFGSKSGSLEKNWVQHRKTQNSCPLPMRTCTVPGRRSKPALTSRKSLGTDRYRSETARNMYNRMDSLHRIVRSNPGEICLTHHRFNHLFPVDHVSERHT